MTDHEHNKPPRSLDLEMGQQIESNKLTVACLQIGFFILWFGPLYFLHDPIKSVIGELPTLLLAWGWILGFLTYAKKMMPKAT